MSLEYNALTFRQYSSIYNEMRNTDPQYSTTILLNHLNPFLDDISELYNGSKVHHVDMKKDGIITDVWCDEFDVFFEVTYERGESGYYEYFELEIL